MIAGFEKSTRPLAFASKLPVLASRFIARRVALKKFFEAISNWHLSYFFCVIFKKYSIAQTPRSKIGKISRMLWRRGRRVCRECWSWRACVCPWAGPGGGPPTGRAARSAPYAGCPCSRQEEKTINVWTEGLKWGLMPPLVGESMVCQMLQVCFVRDTQTIQSSDRPKLLW